MVMECRDVNSLLFHTLKYEKYEKWKMTPKNWSKIKNVIDLENIFVFR